MRKAENTWKMERAKSEWMKFIDISFLDDDLKSEYKKLLDERFGRLG